jgi:hypothetical protein
VLVALMRKLALALYQVAVHHQEFDARRLFARLPTGVPTDGVPTVKEVVANSVSWAMQPEHLRLAHELYTRRWDCGLG